MSNPRPGQGGGQGNRGRVGPYALLFDPSFAASMEYASPDRVFFVAGWLVQPALNRMERGGETVQVEPKVMQVLTVLADHALEPVTREALFETVWAGTFVTEDTLTRCISELRKLFDDDARRPRVIETIPRVGYRLLLPVMPESRSDALPTTLPSLNVALPAPSALPRRRIWRSAWGAAFVLLVGLGGLLAWHRALPPPQASEPVRVRPLTSFPGRETMAAFSPTGDRVAFIWSGRPGDAAADLYVAPIPVAAPLRLTEHPGAERSPAWSPDGQSIAFIRSTPDACGVFVVPALGGPERRLAPCYPGSFASLDWSPDGRWIALSDKDATEAAYTLRMLSAETGVRRDIAYDLDGMVGDFLPRFAPDGSALLFQRILGEGQADLFLLSLPEASLQRLTFDAAGLAGHTWTPGGRAVVFSSNRAGAFNLWRIPAAGGTPEWVAVGDEAFRPSTAPDLLVFERRTVDSNLYEAAATAPPTPVCPSTQMDLFPQISPAGGRVAFVSDRSGSRAIWLCTTDGPTQVTFHPNTTVAAPRWSPDGLRLAYMAFIDGQADVFVVDRFGAPPRPLSAVASNEVYPSWSPDGRWIYFGSDRSGRMEVWKQPAGGGTAEQVTTDGGFIALAAPDGETLYFTREGRSGLWQTPADGGAATVVLTDFDLFTATTWEMLADGFCFIDRSDPAHVQVMKYDFERRTRRPIHDLGGVSVTSGLSVTRDGQRILYTQIDRQEGDFMLVENLAAAVYR